MNFEERIKEIQEEFDKKVKKLKEEFKKEQEENNTSFLNVGDEYFIVYADGIIGSSFWADDIYDRRKLSIGNVFKTKEEAEFEAERLRVLAEIKKYSKPFEIRGNNFVIKYVHQENSIKIGGLGETQYSTLYFESEEIAQKVIDEIGEDNIKKYYLRVE